MSAILRDIPVLCFDCQTTSTNPVSGFPIEAGWVVSSCAELLSPSSTPKVDVHLIKLPAGLSVPSEIVTLTGINDSQLKSASGEGEMWESLLAARASLPEPRIVVAHYARFELGFLHQIQARSGADGAFPFAEMICTHLLAKKLLPDLPAWGIRALSGYFGRYLPEPKRSRGHALSTLHIWSHLVDKLSQDRGIHTFESLLAFMAEPQPRRKIRGTRSYLVSREKRLAIPDSPGIYRMRSSDGTLLYIGKATSLKSRVNSYFRVSSDKRSLLPELLTQVSDIEVVETATALEAALLETDEIKAHQPPYNTSLMDHTKMGRVRKLYFFSRDLERVANVPSVDFPLGPFVSEHIWLRLLQLAAWVKEVPADDEVFPGLDRPELFHLGMEALFPDYSSRREEYARPRFLLGRGLRLRRRSPAPDPAVETEEESEADELSEWTSVDITRRVEDLLVRSAHALYRACWCCRLIDAAVAWDATECPGRSRWLTTRDGKLEARGEAQLGEAPPAVPGPRRSLLARQLAFDIATYDRMRTLLTEINRISGEQRAVHVRLCRQRIIDKPGTVVATKSHREEASYELDR